VVSCIIILPAYMLELYNSIIVMNKNTCIKQYFFIIFFSTATSAPVLDNHKYV